MSFTAAMSIASPVECSLTFPDVVYVAVPALERGDGQPESVAGQVFHRRQEPLVDLTGADVGPPALVDRQARIGEHPALELRLRHQQDLADVGARVRERVLAGGAVDRRRLQQLPAVQDRLRIDPRRARPAGRMAKLTCGASLPVLPIRPSTVPATTCEPFAQLSQLHRVAVEVEDAAEVGLDGLVARELLGQQLVELARDVGAIQVVGTLRQGIEPLTRVLGVPGRRAGLALARAVGRPTCRGSRAEWASCLSSG